jgi:hypothetical protein
LGDAGLQIAPLSWTPDMRCVRCGLLLVLGGYAFGVASDTPARPACTAENVGRFWPDEANDNPKFAAALMPYGYPEVCTLRDGKYAWRSLTVSVNQLRKTGKQPKRKRSKSENSSATSVP